MARPRVYKETYPDDLITKMADGQFDYEIYADWDISKDTFYRWLREYPDLKEAYDIGMAKCLKWWTTIGKQRCLQEVDKGFKYWVAIMNNKFGWGKEEGSRGTVNNTQININKVEITSKEDYLKLASEVQDQLLDLNLTEIKQIEYDELRPEQE